LTALLQSKDLEDLHRWEFHHHLWHHLQLSLLSSAKMQMKCMQRSKNEYHQKHVNATKYYQYYMAVVRASITELYCKNTYKYC